jgi:predicted RNA binding protein YcfA (HicA-like mRNA interferase family)
VSKVPELPFHMIVNAMRRDGWIVVRKRGSHIQLQKRVGDEVRRSTVPAHRPVKMSTLAKILKQASIDVDRFLGLL